MPCRSIQAVLLQLPNCRVDAFAHLQSIHLEGWIMRDLYQRATGTKHWPFDSLLVQTLATENHWAIIWFFLLRSPQKTWALQQNPLTHSCLWATAGCRPNFVEDKVSLRVLGSLKVGLAWLDHVRPNFFGLFPFNLKSWDRLKQATDFAQSILKPLRYHTLMADSTAWRQQVGFPAQKCRHVEATHWPGSETHDLLQGSKGISDYRKL